MRSLSVFWGIVLFVSLTACLQAQTFGEITGDVRDPSGSIIVGADRWRGCESGQQGHWSGTNHGQQ